MNADLPETGAKSAADLCWDIDSIVADLRALRIKSLADRNRGNKPPKLPSRKALIAILDGLSARKDTSTRAFYPVYEKAMH